MSQNNHYKMILGSSSPRRKELIGWLDIPFEVISPEVDEGSVTASSPDKLVENISRLKAQAVLKKVEYKKSLIVCADTTVSLNGKIYGKPKDKSEARAFLKELSGKEHEVVTGVSLATVKNRDVFHTFSVKTLVSFSTISSQILEKYLESGESLDKAGAYGIQGKGLMFVSRIEGSYSNVVGFPLTDFLVEMETFFEKLGEKNFWRCYF